MKQEILKNIIELKRQKKEFAIVTNLENGNSTILQNDDDLDNEFIDHKDQIMNFYPQTPSSTQFAFAATREFTTGKSFLAQPLPQLTVPTRVNN